ELRRRGTLAHDRRRPSRRRLRRAAGRERGGQRRRPRGRALAPAGRVHDHARGKAAHLCARPGRKSGGRPRGARDRPPGGVPGPPVLRRDRRHRRQRPVPDEESAMSGFVTRKAVSRRALLRGAGAALALPFLDSMVPAFASPPKPARRLGYVFIPMGADLSRWTPPGSGKLEKLSPILEPLDPVKGRVCVLTNTELQNAYPATHSSSNSAFLSCARAKHTESSDYRLGTTADQIAAKEIGGETRLPS